MKQRLHGSHSRARGASALMELMVAMILALAAMAGVARLVATVARQYRLRDEQTIAQREIATAMEDLMSRPWDDITSPDMTTLPISSLTRVALPDAKLHVNCTPLETDPQAEVRRVAIEIRWTTAAGTSSVPVRLIAWRYRNQEARP